MLKLEAGKYYRTRDGRKAYVSAVAGVNPFGGDEHAFQVLGFIGSNAATWTAEGWFLKAPTNADLIAEWREPIRKEVPVGLVRKRGTEYASIVVSGPEFDVAFWNGEGYDVLALGKVSLTEGEGL